MILRQIIKESLRIPIPRRNRVRRHEAVRLHLTPTIPQRPVHAGDIRGADLRADGLHVAVLGQPDHELVVARVGDVVDVGGGEEVVADVGADVARVVGPADGRRDAADLADELFVEGDARVGVAGSR